MTSASAVLRLSLLLVVVVVLLSETADSAAVKNAKVKRSVDVKAKENRLRLVAKNDAKLQEKLAKKASLEKMQKKSVEKIAPGKAHQYRAGRDYNYGEEGGDYP